MITNNYGTTANGLRVDYNGKVVTESTLGDVTVTFAEPGDSSGVYECILILGGHRYKVKVSEIRDLQNKLFKILSEVHQANELTNSIPKG